MPSAGAASCVCIKLLEYANVPNDRKLSSRLFDRTIEIDRQINFSLSLNFSLFLAAIHQRLIVPANSVPVPLPFRVVYL